MANFDDMTSAPGWRDANREETKLMGDVGKAVMMNGLVEQDTATAISSRRVMIRARAGICAKLTMEAGLGQMATIKLEVCASGRKVFVAAGLMNGTVMHTVRIEIKEATTWVQPFLAPLD